MPDARLPLRVRLGCYARWCWVRLLFHSGLILWAKWRLRRRRAVLVLTFHRVLDEEAYRNTNSPVGMVMRASTFEAVAAHAARCCEPVALRDGGPESGKPYRKLRVAFTFDDGWADTAARHSPSRKSMRCRSRYSSAPLW
jgi:hypothetical protein